MLNALANVFAQPLRLLFRHRVYVLRKTREDLRRKYSRSILGVLWIVIMPLMFLALYATVQILIYKAERPGIPAPQLALMMFCGLMSIFGLAEGLVLGSGSMRTNKDMLLNSMLPSEVVVAQTTMFGFMTCLIGIPLAMFVSLFVTELHWHVLLAPLVLIMQFMFVLGLSWILSLVALVIQDVQYMLRFLTLSLIIMSPIGYTIEMVPPRLELLVYLNPMSYFIVAYQNLIVFGTFPPLKMVVVMAVMSLTTFGVGYAIFRRIRRTMADLV